MFIFETVMRDTFWMFNQFKQFLFLFFFVFHTFEDVVLSVIIYFEFFDILFNILKIHLLAATCACDCPWTFLLIILLTFQHTLASSSTAHTVCLFTSNLRLIAIDLIGKEIPARLTDSL